MKKVSEEFVDKFFEDITKSLFRLECLQDYSAEDGEEVVKNFIKSGDIGYTISELPFWQFIKKLNEKGIETNRVKIIEYPLSDYIKFSLEFFRQSSIYSGDKVYLLNEKDFKKLNLPGVDYWLKDDRYLLVGTYGEKGKLKYWKYTDTLQEVEIYIKEKEVLLLNGKLI